MAARIERASLASAGHGLGQMIGDWWELDVVFPFLQATAKRLDLFLDNRSVCRGCRSEKVAWRDIDGNIVDYDFVMELGGSPAAIGTPVAFFESFWRRGGRHSKDKARDDTNKLLPMRDTYPTARYLAIAACGEFTGPARDYVITRSVELFYVPKTLIIESFAAEGLIVDYPDRATELEKANLVNVLRAQLNTEKRKQVAERLRQQAGSLMFASFEDTIVGRLSAAPQEIRFLKYNATEPVKFVSVQAAGKFLGNPSFDEATADTSYGYEVTYSDGAEFSREVGSIAELRALHKSVSELFAHMQAVRQKAIS